MAVLAYVCSPFLLTTVRGCPRAAFTPLLPLVSVILSHLLLLMTCGFEKSANRCVIYFSYPCDQKVDRKSSKGKEDGYYYLRAQSVAVGKAL